MIERWILALKVVLFVVVGSVIICIVYAMAYGVSIFEETIEYNEEKYGFYYNNVLVFGKDSIRVDYWHQTIGVDGDNKRVMRILGKGHKKPVFSLPNAVYNYTTTKYYYLQINKHRCLWIEDNFGTTVIDLELMKQLKVKKPLKEHIERTPAGASFGEMGPVTKPSIRKQLNLKSTDQVLLLGSSITYPE